jgi:anti-sigma factor RsiW
VSPETITEEMLHAYVDDRLDPQARSRVERHLAAHPDDAARVADFQAQRRRLRDAYDEVLAEPVPEPLRRTSRPRSAWTLWRVAAALVWMTVGTVLGWSVRDHQVGPEPAPTATPASTLVERARMAHVIYTAEQRRAVEVPASQEDDMIRWLSKRMNTAVRVPDLTAHGFTAMGGRLLPGEDGPACQIMYQNEAGKRLTIYLARDPGKARPIEFSDRDVVHVVVWSDGRLAFAVSADLDREELSRIAQTILRKTQSQS